MVQAWLMAPLGGGCLTEILQIMIVRDSVVFLVNCKVHGTGSILDVSSWSPQVH